MSEPLTHPVLPPFFRDVDEAAGEIGTAAMTRPFQLLIEMLEAYEVRLLVHGIEDPECTKDYIRGFVHGVRSLRSDLIAARAYQATKQKAEEMTKVPREPFRHPGSGPGGLS